MQQEGLHQHDRLGSTGVTPREHCHEEAIRVVAPSEKGKFKLILSVVQEGVSWFEDKQFKSANGLVEVF